MVKISRRWKLWVATAFAAATITGLSGTPANAAPETDTLYNSAQRAFTDGDEYAGRAELRQLIAADPNDAQALSLQAIWSHYAGDLPAMADSLARLTVVDPAMAQATNNVLGAIGAAVATLPNPLPAIIGPQTGIVVLGYGLLPDGSLRPELVNRLAAAWLQAVASPLSPVVVTGGNPQNGVSEAEAMRAWLVAKGLPASRINVENRAGSTVQNALFSTKMLRDIGANSAVVVTSPNHIRRAVADFIVAGTRVVGATTSLDQLVSQLPPPAKQAQHGIYLDATRTFQLTTSR
ncbi:YdcF family protein [Nocardia sp. NPDC051990]|uniref:YdcF family protein n=1 Tax=Nocardia sp. NPDC051990 TaxID=3155285 RepID=UPI00342E0956